MTIKDIINQAQHLSLQEQVSLMRQLTQLIEDNIHKSAPTHPHKTNFRELSGFLHRPEQQPISIEEMNTAIEEEAKRLL